MSRKSRSISKEAEDRINRDLSDSIERKRQTRRNRTDKNKETNEKTKKEKKTDTKKKDLDYVTLDLSSKAHKAFLKAAGLPPDTRGSKLSAKISYKAKK